jgi:hypothetical protein
MISRGQSSIFSSKNSTYDHKIIPATEYSKDSSEKGTIIIEVRRGVIVQISFEDLH